MEVENHLFVGEKPCSSIFHFHNLRECRLSVDQIHPSLLTIATLRPPGGGDLGATSVLVGLGSPGPIADRPAPQLLQVDLHLLLEELRGPLSLGTRGVGYAHAELMCGTVRLCVHRVFLFS